jgi:hypothetical protein
VAVYNWQDQPQVSLDLSAAGLTMGQSYEIRHAQGFLSMPPVYSGAYTGAPVTIDMTGLAVEVPVGSVPVPPRSTAPRFGAFVVLPTQSGTVVTPTAPLTASPAGGRTPYRGLPVSIPGVVQAEEFDEGGEGVAYHDWDMGNAGGALRATDVDLEASTDPGGGYNVGWMSEGEWLAYSVNVMSAGAYTIEVRVASNGAGGTFHVEANSSDVTGPLVIPNTGGWQNWTTLTSAGVSLAAGPQTLRIVLDSNGSTGVFGNINFLSVTSSGVSPVPEVVISAPAPEVVISASDVPAAALHGSWAFVADPTSPQSTKLSTPDNGSAQLHAPLATPADYVDVNFTAPAGVAYTVWVRLRATSNSKWNDAVWLQFSDASSNGTPMYPMNTTSGLLVNLATDGTASSLNAWGWVNSAYWLNQVTTLTFASDGTHTVRVQVREDGVELDQIVLSPRTYSAGPPGPVTNDSTIVSKP